MTQWMLEGAWMVGVKKEKPRKASHSVCLPGAALSGLSDGWGSLSTRKQGQDRPKMAEYFGVDLALAQHILGLPANQMPSCP